MVGNNKLILFEIKNSISCNNFLLVKTIEQLNKNHDVFCLFNNFDQKKIKLINSLKYNIKLINENSGAIEIYPGDLVYKVPESEESKLVLMTKWGGIKRFQKYNLPVNICVVRPSSLSFMKFVLSILNRENITYTNYKIFFLLSSFLKISKNSINKRQLFITSEKKSDGIYALKNYRKFFKDQFIACHNTNFRIFYGTNYYSFYAKNFIEFLASIYANSIYYKNIFLYFSLAGAPILKEIINYVKYDYKTIHIAHGRVSSDKFLHRTDAVITQLQDSRYANNSIRQFIKYNHEKFYIENNKTYLFLHGYKKGKKYSIRNLLSDLTIIKRISCDCNILLIKVHPTAQLLTLVLNIMNIKKIVVIDGNKDNFFIEKIFSSSPTYSVLLNKLGLPFECVSKK